MQALWNVDSVSDSFLLDAPIDATQRMRNDSIASLIRRVICDFEAVGVSINSSSRLHQYAALFDLSLTEACADSLHSKLDLALLESLQFKAIRRCLDHAPACPELLLKIAEASGGSFDASRDKSDSRSRSTQFELFLFSCLLAVGVKATFGEPDVLVRGCEDRTIGIAAKRPRSEKKFLKCLRAGCRQIAMSGRDGLVAIDLSFIESLNKPIYIRDASKYQTLSKIIVDDFVLENMRRICTSAYEPLVIGVLFYYSGVMRTINEPVRLVSRRWLFLQTKAPPPDQDILLIIKRLQKLGQPTDQLP
jgi:hypothetical protein